VVPNEPMDTLLRGRSAGRPLSRDDVCWLFIGTWRKPVAAPLHRVRRQRRNPRPGSGIHFEPIDRMTPAPQLPDCAEESRLAAGIISANDKEGGLFRDSHATYNENRRALRFPKRGGDAVEITGAGMR